jgi:type IV secretion system protein VirB9
MIRYWLTILLLLIAAPLFGQVRPIPGAGDPRLQTIDYNPDQIVQLGVASGYQLMVSFAPGERVETIAVGDSNAWQVTTNKRGDYLFIKALGDGRTTNMTVVTDSRVYMFELIPSTPYVGDQAFSLRFTYPEDQMVAKAEAEALISYRYRIGGARALRPSFVLQEGPNLIVEWPSTAALPAIFRIEEDGKETLVNSEIKNGRFLIAGLPKMLLFRLDRQVATAVRLKAKVKRQ